jgi:HlyD family secretion protein
MHRKPRIIAGATVLALTGALIVYRTTFASSNDTDIVAAGTVEATQADLGFQLAGRLQELNVREGDQVAAGQTLGTLERAELVAQRAMAQAQVDAARAQLSELVAGSRAEEIERARASLASATARRDAAQRDVERLSPLAEQSLVSRQAFDHQKTELGIAEGDVTAAAQELRLLEIGPRTERIAAQRAVLAQAAATVQRIDAMLDNTVLKAPFAGTVTVRHREAGEALSPGTPVLTIRNLSERWVRIYVPGDEVGRLSVGQTAAITADAYPERTYVGTISYIASVAEFTPRNVQTTKDRVKLVYEVRVRISGDSALDLKPGLPADVQLKSPSLPATH